VPVWGVIEPGARRAAAATAGHVGVIATESTVRSDAYAAALRRIDARLRVDSRPCPLFVPLVEEGWHDDPVTEQVAARYLGPLVAGGIDTLVLGCTHYPLLRPLLARVAGDGVVLVDSAETVAEEVAAGLAEAELAAPPGACAEHRLYLTDTSEGFARLARRILDDPEIEISWIEVV
jgi:glutamate racemase